MVWYNNTMYVQGGCGTAVRVNAHVCAVPMFLAFSLRWGDKTAPPQHTVAQVCSALQPQLDRTQLYSGTAFGPPGGHCSEASPHHLTLTTLGPACSPDIMWP